MTMPNNNKLSSRVTFADDEAVLACDTTTTTTTTTTTPFVDFVKTTDSTILPTRFAPCSELCYTLLNPKPATLYPNMVNEIHLGFYPRVKPGFLLQLGYHSKSLRTNYTWRLISNYLKPELVHEIVSVLILTTRKITIARGELLGYLHVLPVSSTLASILGNLILCYISNF
jgi:hypothetical protein